MLLIPKGCANPNRERRHFICEECKEEFTRLVTVGGESGGACSHANNTPRKCNNCKSNSVKRQLGDIVVRLCTGCNSEFSFAWSGVRRRLCDKCRHRPLRATEKVCLCVVCGEEFETTRRKRYCSDECRRAADRTAKRGLSGKCSECGRICKGVMCRACYIQKQGQEWRHAQDLQEQGLLPAALPGRIGDIGEVMFDLLCVQKGWQVWRNDLDHTVGVDRVIVRDGGLARVQIKATTHMLANSLASKVIRTNTKAADFCALVSLKSWQIVLVPLAGWTAETFNIEEYEAWNLITGKQWHGGGVSS